MAGGAVHSAFRLGRRGIGFAGGWDFRILGKRQMQILAVQFSHVRLGLGRFRGRGDQKHIVNVNRVFQTFTSLRGMSR